MKVAFTACIDAVEDIHRNADPMRHSQHVYAVTASGAARPGFGGNTGSFGLLDIGATIAAWSSRGTRTVLVRR